MSKLEEIKANVSIAGILPDSLVTIVNIQWFGTDAVEIIYKSPTGKVDREILYRSDESRLKIVERGRPWSFDGDGSLFRLVSEANRIRLAYLFDPVLAVHTSLIEPLPHQITGVYETMLQRQPLRFLLADDPGSGKTIMAGLLIKELIARGDLQRCMIVAPGSLVEQWQDELYEKFSLRFEIMTNDNFESACTGNWFCEHNLVIVRLDKMSRNEDIQAKLRMPECRWDLVVCDEAHKLSATFFGGEVKYTKRYKFGELLSTLTRHFLLMTATPHNGKEEDFQLFLALLDGDRFEGRFRDGVHQIDTSDLMRRMIKENLVKFDGTPLFPERIAYTVPYKLSDGEANLYREVTEYVREQFNRAEKLQNDKRINTVGFALTILQRRLASSPEAIYQSLRRRRERLENKLREIELLKRESEVVRALYSETDKYSEEYIDDLDEAPENEVTEVEEAVLDEATAAGTINELKAEIETLRHLESLGNTVRRSGEDKKWSELAKLLTEDIFTPASVSHCVAEEKALYSSQEIKKPIPSPRQKLIIFTEHRDTLRYLKDKISTLLGRPDSIVCIHGGMGREERKKSQESFTNDPEVQVLLATDAAGEGINLQRAHLMVNYDLPWNPNRIEQRFGRIHRINQTEVCHLWNLVANETREGEVYQALLRKLEEARKALGGKVFDVLGKVQFEGKPLRDLLIEAIRYGEQPETRGRLTKVIANAFDTKQLQLLLEERALVHDAIDSSRVKQIRENMERAEARRLQPHYIESFFLKAFEHLGGVIKQREPHRYEITNVPSIIRSRDRIIGLGNPIVQRYERIVFEKSLISPPGQPQATFVCPGHPLLDVVADIILERNRDLLRRGTILVDENDSATDPRVLFYLEHAIQDGTTLRNGDRRVISKQMLYVELDTKGNTYHPQYAPYLDYRPLKDDEPKLETILGLPECSWITHELEDKVQGYAISQVVPCHLKEIRERKLDLIAKTERAVKERLSKEINYWDHRAEVLKIQEQSGRINAKLNSAEARKRADALQERLQNRLAQLNLEKQISALSPVILGGLLIVPIGLIAKMKGQIVKNVDDNKDKMVVAAKARELVMRIERHLGFEPIDREAEKLGYDIESRIPGTGKLRFLEVKGRYTDANTLTVTRNEILYSLNKPDDFILAIVEFIDENNYRIHYLRQPFHMEPDFGVTSVNYDFAELLSRAEEPS